MGNSGQKIKIDYTDPLSQYRSGRTAKIVKESDLKQSEWSIQLKFCKWIKLQYPNLLFRSDIQSAGKLSGAMQNIKQILDPYKGFPDIQIYLPKGNYIGLFIELKRLDSGTFLKDGTLSKSKHVQDQAAMHNLLRSFGYRVEFAEGFEEAKQVLESYLKN
jgi:hypothetical protein